MDRLQVLTQVNMRFGCSDTWWEIQTEVPAVEAVPEAVDADGNVVTEAVEAQEAYTRKVEHYQYC